MQTDILFANKIQVPFDDGTCRESHHILICTRGLMSLITIEGRQNNLTVYKYQPMHQENISSPQLVNHRFSHQITLTMGLFQADDSFSKNT